MKPPHCPCNYHSCHQGRNCINTKGDQAKRCDPLPAATAEPSDVRMLREALGAAIDFISSSPHGDNCFLHDDGGEYDACFCGKDSILSALERAQESELPDAARNPPEAAGEQPERADQMNKEPNENL